MMQLKEIKNNKKIGIWIGTISVFVFLLVIGGSELSMLSYRKTCGKFIRKYRVKSSNYYEFEYVADESKVRSARSIIKIKMRDVEKLEKIDCIELVYSNIIPSNFRIIDKSIGQENLWFINE